MRLNGSYRWRRLVRRTQKSAQSKQRSQSVKCFASKIMQGYPQLTDRDHTTITVPRWSLAVAAATFLVVEYYVWFVLEPRHRAPVGLRVYLNVSWGNLAALYCLTFGYISKDAPLRSMNAYFWMLICFAMPLGIGAPLYLLLRQPILSCCPSCGTLIQSECHFCPQCRRRLLTTCPRCFQLARDIDHFCTRCGHTLTEQTKSAKA